MRIVIHQEMTGCGIASVATLAGMTYRQLRSAAQQLNISVKDRQLWSDMKYVRTLLCHYGLRAADKERPFHSWEMLPDLALLAIKWHMERGHAYWHWVVFWREPHGAVVLDPKRALRTHRRTDFGRMKPKWFIEISSHRNRRTRTAED